MYTHSYACEVSEVLIFDHSTLAYQCSTVVWFTLSVTRFLQSCIQQTGG